MAAGHEGLDKSMWRAGYGSGDSEWWIAIVIVIMAVLKKKTKKGVY